MQWFRMYAEFLTDPLIRMLSFEDQRHFVAALCLKASGVLDKQYATPALRRRVLSQLIGLSCDDSDGKVATLDEANRRLKDMGLVDESWQPINWEKRQFQSDSSADRTRRWRQKRHSDVTVTVQNRTDTEQNRTEQNRLQRGSGGDVRATRANLAQRLPEAFELTEKRRGIAEAERVDPEREFARFSDHFRAAGGSNARKRDWDAAWRNWCRRAADQHRPSSNRAESVLTWRPPPDDTDVQH